jgi:hypothetical protein
MLMTRDTWLGHLLRVGAVFEAGAGLGLLAAPSAVATLALGAPIGDAGAAIARIGGGGLLALGISCWSAHRVASTPVGLGVARAFLVYNVVACVILAMAAPPLPAGLVAAGASLLHGVLAVALVAGLRAASWRPDAALPAASPPRARHDRR